MPRRNRMAIGGIVYHVLNRANAGMRLFETEGDYLAFAKVLCEACKRTPMRILSYALMPNHWHMMLWPHHDRQLSLFMQWLASTHTQRWHYAHNAVGLGHLYQERFKNFPVESDRHYLTVQRYVERNPLRAKLVGRAEEWHWSSLRQRTSGPSEWDPPLSAGPVDLPDNWLAVVNLDQMESDVNAVRACILRSRPYGDDDWVARTARKLHLESTLRPRGRPKKGTVPFLGN